MTAKQFLSTTDAGRMLGISRIAVFKKIRQGRMAAVMIGGSYAISATAVSKEKMLMGKRKSRRSPRHKKFGFNMRRSPRVAMPMLTIKPR